MKSKSISFVAGLSGGHIIPCLTLAQRYKQSCNDTDITFFSTNKAGDCTIIDSSDSVDRHIKVPVHNIPRSRLQYPFFFLAFISTCIKSCYFFARYRPDRLITTGGIVSIPVALAAWLLRIPIDAYELNAVPGKAITFLAPFAQNIYCPFKQTIRYFPKKGTYKPYPIRYSSNNRVRNAKQIRQRLSLDLNKKTIFILGGSQGSAFLNDSIKKFVLQEKEISNRIQIIHQTGSQDATAHLQQIYKKQNITAHVIPFCNDLSQYYIAADLVISRSGSGAIFEADFFQKKCILVPLITETTQHQVNNALAAEKYNGQLFTIFVSFKELFDDNNFFKLIYKNLQ